MNVMKILAATLLMGSVSFAAQAAEEVTKEQVEQMKLQKIGTISSNKETTSPMDAKKELSDKADEMGGKYYLVIAAAEKAKISATADVYK